jgi:glycosyltransferase involved in cell wall biosynthesis
MSGTINHIAFVTHNYPSPGHPSPGIFVQQLVHAVAAQGVACTVIHPYKAHKWIRERRLSDGRNVCPAGSLVEQLQPPYCSFSSKRIGPWNTFHATQFFFTRAVWQAVRRFKRLPDVIYGHFLYSGGAAAARVGVRLHIPSVVAVGEGTFWSVEPMGFARAKRDFRDVTGVIAVSSVLRKKLIAQLDIPDEKIAVFPNAVDHGRFYPRDRAAMRAKFGLPQDTFIVAYVGNFLPEKGVAAAAAAIDGLAGVGGVFAGSGPLTPTGANVLFRGVVPHESVPELLSAADVFLLPSDVEGSSNATVEALACGLPVIVSEGDFNDDIVNDQVAVRVDPRDVASIRRAILFLKGDPAVRNAMAVAAYEKSKQLDIVQRARAVLEWMRSKVARP